LIAVIHGNFAMQFGGLSCHVLMCPSGCFR
jgi:hypothetical protein